MKYGCIGEHLGHSFSKEIHSYLADYEYSLKEIAPQDLDAFMREKDFCAINVTIPYKRDVIKYLDYISDEAKDIGAVNTVVNKGSALYGYNTDFMGMTALILKNRLEFKNKKVAILGTGGTSMTAAMVSKHLGAKEIYTVSRSEKEGSVTYDMLYKNHADVDFVINTTPCGMYPRYNASPLNLDRLYNLSGVIDAVYNPLNTMLVLDAKNRGITAEGGLYMLVSQAVYAAEKFLDTTISPQKTDEVFSAIYRCKENIVLTGMPSCGKTTIGNLLSKELGRQFIDVDELIEKEADMPIPKIFEKHGEEYFRDLEEKIICEKVAPLNSAVISTGGGAVLRESNMKSLKTNGRVYFIDRPLEKLIPTGDRPLSSTHEALEKKYSERYDIYIKHADVKIDNSADIENALNKIKNDYLP